MADNQKRKFNILGISIWKLFIYFIVYSIAGYIIETLFALATMGVLECRQSFFYGPFLGIYGVGAVCIILFSQYIFISRVVVENNIEMDNIERYQTLYDKTCKNELINKLWNNEKMVKTFPNMKIKDKNDNIIYLRDLLPDIQQYYWKK